MATRKFKLKYGQHYIPVGHIVNVRKEKIENYMQFLMANLIGQTQINTNEDWEM